MKNRKDLLVVDTNIFINALFGNGMFKSDDRILDLEENNLVRFAFSRDTFDELIYIVSKRITESNTYRCSIFFETLYLIKKRSVFIENVIKQERISRDGTDQKFIDLAVTCEADFHITNDKKNGLLDKGSYKGVKIVTPSDYIKIFEKAIKAN